MNLSIRYIYHKILKKDPTAYIVDEHAIPLKIQWISVASPHFANHAGFLYFVEDESDLPSLEHEAQGGFGCIVSERLSDRCRGIPRIVVDDDANQDSIFEYLVTEVEKYRTWHDSVNELLVSNASYQEILEVTAQFVPRPMYIADANWRMVSHQYRGSTQPHRRIPTNHQPSPGNASGVRGLHHEDHCQAIETAKPACRVFLHYRYP